jgi:hypothetical protein
MEEKKAINHRIAGLLIGAILAIYSIVINFLNLGNSSGTGLLQLVIIIGALIFFVHQYGKSKNFTETFGNLFAYGFKTTAVFTIISIVFSIIFFLVFPEMKEQSLEIARQKMEEKHMPDDQIEQAINITKKFFWVGVIGGSMLFLIIIGAIGSLIGAAITKKQPRSPF